MSAAIHNFGAGPGVLPHQVLLKVQAELLDFAGTGMSILEISHRSPQFENILNQSASTILQFLQLPSNFMVLFVQGGASNQFSAVPLNLLTSIDHVTETQPVDFLVTGTWSKKAYQEAARFIGSRARIVNSSENDLKQPFSWSSTEKPAYFYYCENETVDGVELVKFPLDEFHAPYTEIDVPVVCDMSSNFLSRPVPHAHKYAIIMAGAQKNVGPAGLTIVIIRQDLLKKHELSQHKHIVPIMLDYAVAARNNSLYNTPPVFSIYVSSLVLDWIKTNGGLEWIGKRNHEKALLIYSTIDSSAGYYYCPVVMEYRSRMNVVFRICPQPNSPDKQLEAKFVKEAEAKGMMQLAGHRSVGGLRASLYNALGLESVKVLVEFMKEFQLKNKK